MRTLLHFLAAILLLGGVGCQSAYVKKAICVLHPTQGNQVSGVVTFTQMSDHVLVEATVSGSTPGKHGFHIHQFGDTTSSDGKSTGGHFNPTMMDHAGPHAKMRHSGDMGNIHAANGDFATTSLLWERAFEIKERLLGPDHPDTALSLGNLGFVYMYKRDYARATKHIERVVEILEGVYPSGHPRLAFGLAFLAQLKLLQDQEAEAEPLHQRAVEIFESTQGLDHPDCQLHQASYFAILGERVSALEHLRRATTHGLPATWSIHDPAFDSLRGDPEFEAIVSGFKEGSGQKE